MTLCLEEWQKQFVISSYAEGLRSNNLEGQPAPWMIEGLKVLEAGKVLTIEMIKTFSLAGGTDHPDPYFG